MRFFFTRAASRIVLSAALAAISALAHAAPVQYTGRGLYHFPSQSGCPFKVADNACNRIALDASSASASVDTAQNTITFSSASAGPDDNVAGDVLLQGSAVDEQGQRVPISVQVLLRLDAKKTWSADVYPHLPKRGGFTDARLDAYSLIVMQNGAPRIMLTPQDFTRVVTNASAAARLARSFVEVKPTNAAQPSGQDITIALGVGKLAKPMLRVAFQTNAAPNADALQTLSTGTWSIELDALSHLIPQWAVRRELFLFDLEDQVLLQRIREHGFSKGDRLVLGARQGQGYLRLNGDEIAFANAAHCAGLFLQDSFMGLILQGNARPPQVSLNSLGQANWARPGPESASYASMR